MINYIQGNLLIADGTGFNDIQRADIWNNKSDYLNKIITYKYQPFGMQILPRIPIFKGFRHTDDF